MGYNGCMSGLNLISIRTVLTRELLLHIACKENHLLCGITIEVFGFQQNYHKHEFYQSVEELFPCLISICFQ